jgi:taurine dioxygenase
MNDDAKAINPYFTPNIVHTNIAGKTGFYFSPLQVFYFVGMTEDESQPIIKKLQDHIIQERFMYHHDWQDNDLVLSEQWLGIHKRWYFEGIKQRTLHRIESDFSHIKF